MSFGKYTREEAIAKLKQRQEKARNKPRKPKIKRSKAKIKKIRKVSVSKLHELVWDECKRIIKTKYDHVCYTCNKPTNGKFDTHTGHGLSKGSLSLRYKYDLRNLKIQCMRCNIHLQGNQEIFLGRLQNEQAGIEFLLEAGYKDENGAWRCKKEEPLNARDFLTTTLQNLKLM